MLQVRKVSLTVIPAKLESLFINRVIGSYFDIVSNPQYLLLTEMLICDEMMVDVLSRTASLEIFEDEYFFEDLDEESKLHHEFEDYINYKEDGFIFDVVNTLKGNSLSFYTEADEEFHNLPTKEVW